ncbi:MAG TPA: transketolase [Bacteroidales bacterium]|nr:MAG: transketolase [Bacteroidetes bacterium GWE2_42_24]OFY31610.1 MAG: transketolase [Bacteroidetes bacterium GWF2_43_11]HAQ64417.1 transketolase [Bacteroidales bacterium]HBZ67133.1 transketolase [Bacteroidales bacterium]
MKKTESVTRLKEIALQIRTDVIESLASAGSGHLGGSLGLADVFTVLYFYRLTCKPAEPSWPQRDRLILSIGHVAPVLYAALANAGYFDRTELATLRKLDSRLQGHPGRDHGLPGLELSAGSLGQGISVAVGMALAAKSDAARWHTWCICGDGELQEGSVWEAAMAAAHHKLDNLTVIVDRNNLQIDGPTESVMALEPLADKWKSFGWNVMECNGNSVDELLDATDNSVIVPGKPTVIIAHTIMGCGIRSIEGNFRWHGKAPSKEEAMMFIDELNHRS